MTEERVNGLPVILSVTVSTCAAALAWLGHLHVAVAVVVFVLAGAAPVVRPLRRGGSACATLLLVAVAVTAVGAVLS